MKHGTEYAKRVKRLHQRLLKSYGKPSAIEPTDPIEQMVVGILSQDTSMSRAQSAYRRLVGEMVDLNELRVTPPSEIAEQIDGLIPMASDKARRIVDALNAVRRRQDTLDLDFLKQRGRREAREYLESLEGLTPFVAAQVVLFSLQGHAIPVDNLTLYVLRKKELVDPEADIPTVQGFLERNINASDAAGFVQLLDRFVAASGGRVEVSELPALLSPAPPPSPVAASAEGEQTDASSETTKKSQSDVAPSAVKSAASKSAPSKAGAKHGKSGTAKRSASKKSKPASKKRTGAAAAPRKKK